MVGVPLGFLLKTTKNRYPQEQESQLVGVGKWLVSGWLVGGKWVASAWLVLHIY